MTELVRRKLYDLDCKFWICDKLLPVGEIMSCKLLGLDKKHFNHRVLGNVKSCLPCCCN